MVTRPLIPASWKRRDAQEAILPLRNRYFEKNPANFVEGNSLISRPGLKAFTSVGDGPCRGLYTQPGSFDDALFMVSNDALYRIDIDGSNTFIGNGIFGTSLRASVSMAATGTIGSTPEYLFLADGQTLWLYTANSYARGVLTATGAIANGDKIQIGTSYYQWTSGSVDSGTPAGTSANPWLVALGASNADAIDNMAFAVAGQGTPGTNYSTALTANTAVTYQTYTNTELVVRALDAGVAGNSIALAVDVGANIAWDGATLQHGGSPTLTQVQVPDDLGVISVGYIASFVIVVVTQGQGYNGRFFWIEPGETIIRPLNFATAERSPDPVYSVRVVGDRFWLLGQSTTEIWYPTGDSTTPFLRIQGQLFDRGVWEGTDVQIKENLILVDSDGAVFNLKSGLERISDPSIEERVRKAIAAQKASTEV